MLSLKQLQDVCMMGAGATECRYLAEYDSVANGFYCLKKTSVKNDIDKEMKIFIKEHKANGINPTSVGVPLGDNCKGYIVLKKVQQGYDV